MARLTLLSRRGIRPAHSVNAMAEEESPASLHLLHEHARAIFAHALDACRIENAFHDRIRFEGTTLLLEYPPEMGPNQVRQDRPPARIELGKYREILIVALGKAAVPMTQSLLEILPPAPRVRGICSAPSRPARPDPRIRYYAGGHPLPNSDSFRAARGALRLLGRASGETFVIYLISGGGSTLCDLPLDPGISLDDTIAFHQALIASGATIGEMNTLRKHFSAVKGGRLATAAPDALKLTLQVVDVPWHQADAVASGPTLADPSTVNDCRELLERYQLLEKFPASVRSFFSRPDLPETPGDKVAMKQRAQQVKAAVEAGREGTSFTGFSRQPAGLSNWLATLLSNRDLLRAAREKAAALGYEVIVDNACDDWPYEKAAGYLVDRLVELRGRHADRKVCLLSGGEVTVHLDRQPGTGGRNQQFALACALLFHERLRGQPVVCLSAGSDGADGNSPAAGALADPSTITRAQALGFDAQAALDGFDACPLLTALGDSLRTGPTGNNLRDLRILLHG
jgi:glycerate 2-kinase